MKISAVYKITNTVTGDFYIGSSKDVKSRWANHKCKSTWNKHPNNPMYLDMQKYGVDKFAFEILAVVEIEKLKETEQQFIEKLQPTYNNYNAKGWNIERQKEYKKEYNKEYNKTDKYKNYQKEYQKSDKFKDYHKSDKYKESHRKSSNKYNNQLCFYNGETLTLSALRKRFMRKGISNPTQEVKKYLIGGNDD